MAELHPGVVGGELPIDATLVGVGGGLPGDEFDGEDVKVVDAAVQGSPGQDDQPGPGGQDLSLGGVDRLTSPTSTPRPRTWCSTTTSSRGRSRRGSGCPRPTCGPRPIYHHKRESIQAHPPWPPWPPGPLWPSGRHLTGDVRGDVEPYDGTHQYVLRFTQEQLPPVNAFWSITMFDQDSCLVDNPVNRCGLGDRSNHALTATAASAWLSKATRRATGQTRAGPRAITRRDELALTLFVSPEVADPWPQRLCRESSRRGSKLGPSWRCPSTRIHR